MPTPRTDKRLTPSKDLRPLSSPPMQEACSDAASLTLHTPLEILTISETKNDEITCSNTAFQNENALPDASQFIIKNKRLQFSQPKLALEFHPITVARLHQFHTNFCTHLHSCAIETLTSSFAQFVECYGDLVALLVEEFEGDLAKAVVRIVAILFPPLFYATQSQFTSIATATPPNDAESVICALISRVAHKIFYTENVFLWEANVDLLPPPIGSMLSERRRERLQLAARFVRLRQTLSGEQLATLLSPSRKNTAAVAAKENEAPNAAISAANNAEALRKEPSGYATPKKRRAPASEAAAVQTPSAKLAVAAEATAFGGMQSPSSRPQKKVSEFFTVVERKPDAAIAAKQNALFGGDAREISTDAARQPLPFDRIFKPFFVKENVRIAPPNAFAFGKRTPKHLIERTFNVNGTPKRARFAAKTPKGRVYDVADDSRPAIFKLLQFHDNYRPAYFGTFRKLRLSAISPRNPFAKDSHPETPLNYEVDSDEEWEEEELGDVEIIQSEDEDASESDDLSDADDGFLVPDDYISAEDDDEDADALHESADLCVSVAADSKPRHNAPLPTRRLLAPPAIVDFMAFVSAGGDAKHGIFVVYHRVPNMPLHPFAVCSPQENREGISASASSTASAAITAAYAPKFPFPEAHTDLLLQVNFSLLFFICKIIADNPTHGIAKLFALFMAAIDAHTPCKISKRSFERKVNSVAQKDVRLGSKSRWVILQTAVEKACIE